MPKNIESALVLNRVLSRFSTGIFPLDVALGGGLPRGRVTMFVGKESTGKSLIAQKCSESISKLDWETGELGGFTKTLYIDMENSFDEEWAKGLGWDSRNDVACPDDGSHACDIIREAITCGEYGLIIGDSLDTFYPSKVDERSAQDGGLPGARAQLLNTNFVHWTGQLRKMAREVPPHKLPTLLFINQYRLTIGGAMYSDPRVIPGGEGQRYYSSIICSMKSPKVSNVGSVESAVVEINGTIIKNKVAPPKKNFTFTVGLVDNDDLKQGEVNNFKGVFDILKLNQIQKVKTNWLYLGQEYKTQKEIMERLQSEPEFYKQGWELALKELKGGE